MSNKKEPAISEKNKNDLIRVMRDYEKGSVGILSLDVESILVSSGAPRLASLLATELMVEAIARYAKKNPNPDIGETEEKSYAIIDLVRKHVRDMSDEEFDSFTSKESLDKVVGRLREAAVDQEYGSCAECDLDPEKLPN